MDILPTTGMVTKKPSMRIVLMTIVALLVVGFGIWLLTRISGTSVPAAPPAYTVIVPNAWKTGDTVTIPQEVKTPEAAVHEVENIPGYRNETPREVRSVYGEDGALYWAVKTDRGYVTVKAAATPSTP